MTDKKIYKRNMLSKEPIIKAFKEVEGLSITNRMAARIYVQLGVKKTLLAFGWTEDEANRIIEECSNEAQ